MVPQQRQTLVENGARAASIGMMIVVVAAMLIALFGWHPWSGGT
jgi:hypothetical protein